MTGLRDLPPELIVVVSESLNLQDVCRWATVSRHFYRVIMFNESIAKHALELSAPRARETRDAQASTGLYAQGLRRSMKTLNAIATGTPFQVAFVAMADNFVYMSGMLCYTQGRESIHLLDMHSAAREEIVIDSRKLLDAAVEASKSVIHYSFYPIHYAEGLLCCRYEHKVGINYVSYVVIVDPLSQRILESRQIPSRSRYWVGIANTSVLLVSREEATAIGQHRWVLRCFDISTRTWVHDHVPLESLSQEIYSNTLCFEVVGDYFYAVSVNPGRLNDTTMEWTSTYFVSRHHLNNLGEPTERHFFRRRQEEGPIHDAWSTLKLEQDPETGLPMILEVRMEWLQAVSPSIRTCYKTAIDFTDETLASGFSVSVPSPDSSIRNDFWMTSGQLPSVRGPRQREPATFHRGDHGDTLSYDVPKRCCLRSYHPLCETFVDVVWEETLVEGQQPCQTMRLRTISRPHSGSVNKVNIWPPLGGSVGRKGDRDPLVEAMTIRGHRDSFRGVMDDRSMVVTVTDGGGERHGPKTPLLFISFDPASRIADSGCHDLPNMPGFHERKGIRHPSRWSYDESHGLGDTSVQGLDEAGSEHWARTRPSCFSILVSNGKRVQRDVYPDNTDKTTAKGSSFMLGF